MGTPGMIATDSQLNKNVFCRLTFACIFFFLCYYFFSNTLVHQLRSPVLTFPYVDITYWLFHLLQIPEFITRNYFISISFDIMLFATCILSFIFPLRRIFILLFFLLYLLYFIIFNSYGTHHTHSKIGILLMPIPFLFKPGQSFKYMWDAMRYFTLFVYADAFLWKLARGNYLLKDQGALIVKKNYAAYAYYHQNTMATQLINWLLAHSFILDIVFLTGVVMEGAFIVGFFTRRFDKYLLVLSVLLPVGFLLMSDAFFFELLVLSFTLISFDKKQEKKLPGNKLQRRFA